jgi:hypothetical protein
MTAFYVFLISYDSCCALLLDTFADSYAWPDRTVFSVGLGGFAFSAATTPGKL